MLIAVGVKYKAAFDSLDKGLRTTFLKVWGRLTVAQLGRQTEADLVKAAVLIDNTLHALATAFIRDHFQGAIKGRWPVKRRCVCLLLCYIWLRHSCYCVLSRIHLQRLAVTIASFFRANRVNVANYASNA